MLHKEVLLNSPERFESQKDALSIKKLENAAWKAIRRLEKNIDKFGNSFIDSFSVKQKYHKAPIYPGENLYWRYWTNGLYTGEYLLAYELTGDKKFFDIVSSHYDYYKERAYKSLGLNDHDVGFLYSPSCVAAYKITGDKSFRDVALVAADILYEHFSERGWYLRRGGNDTSLNEEWHRATINSMMNIPLLMWAGNETLNGKYINAAILNCNTTIKYLVRDDGSTYHHYQFDPKTQNPLGGVSSHGAGVDGCWSRGHAWALYGFPIAYSYTQNEEFIRTHKNLAYYFLNNLPSDGIPYWDFLFTDGSTEPRDSSALIIAICGLLEMIKHLNNNEPQKKIFENACAYMMNAIIDTCSNDSDDADGLLMHSSTMVREGAGIDECTVFGDYFYLEALVRYLKPNWKMYW